MGVNVKRCRHRITSLRYGRVRCHRVAGHWQRWCEGWGERGALFQFKKPDAPKADGKKEGA